MQIAGKEVLFCLLSNCEAQADTSPIFIHPASAVLGVQSAPQILCTQKMRVPVYFRPSKQVRILRYEDFTRFKGNKGNATPLQAFSVIEGLNSWT